MKRTEGRIGALWLRYRRDFGFRTLVSAGLSLAVTALFALYNGWLGLSKHSVWHGSICLYYLLLTAIRGAILSAERRRASLSPPRRRIAGHRAYRASSAALLIVNLALVIPITLMTRLLRPVNMGLVPAIAMAAHTVWKITMAVINFRRRRASRDLLVRLLRTITLIDALVSLLSLQNTLIMVVSGNVGRSMLTMTAVSSGLIFLGILAISVANLFGRRQMARGRSHT